MNLFSEAMAWLFAPERFTGPDSLQIRIGEHLFYTFVSLLIVAPSFARS